MGRQSRLMRWVNGWSIASLAGTVTASFTLWISVHFKCFESGWLGLLFLVALSVGVLTLPCAWVTKLMARVRWQEVLLILVATDFSGVMGLLFLWFAIDTYTISVPFLWFQSRF